MSLWDRVTYRVWMRWDDPVWEWAVRIPLPFGLSIRFGRTNGG